MNYETVFAVSMGVIAGGIIVSLIMTALMMMRKSSANHISSRIRQEAEKEAEHVLREAKVTAKIE
jgi:MFS superfamily sulfate permease-like transporter